MVRLIDAEHLIQKAEQEKKDGLLEDDELETIYYELSDEPTVDAIPIEYIKNQIGRWERSKCQSYHAICYRHLIEEWQTENERKEE